LTQQLQSQNIFQKSNRISGETNIPISQ